MRSWDTEKLADGLQLLLSKHFTYKVNLTKSPYLGLYMFPFSKVTQKQEK